MSEGEAPDCGEKKEKERRGSSVTHSKAAQVELRTASKTELITSVRIDTESLLDLHPLT